MRSLPVGHLRRGGATAAVVALAPLAGCGLGAGTPATGVTLTVTVGHGNEVLLDRPHPATGGEDTVLRLLQRNTTVKTKYGGQFVTSIAGSGAAADGDWFFWVDGVAADRGAAAWRLRDGDRVWWDRGASEAAPGETPAVVGSFPAPLVGGFDGRAGTVDLRCAEPNQAACRLVRQRLVAVHVRSATPAEVARPPGAPGAPVRVVVG
ncbi:MAG: DUF4430 domain-containing protein, partial [Solirubrobacteraceae bacterium]|nr:DUF4430 domain-containing protein [Patulibacter sp.]